MRFSIRWAFLLGFLGLIWGTQIITNTSSYFTSQKVLDQHAKEIMTNIAELAMVESQNHLSYAYEAAVLTTRLIADDFMGEGADIITAVERYFFNQLELHPHFTGIYLGFPNGDFYDVRNHYRGDISCIRTKFIQNQGTFRSIKLKWRDSNYKIIDSAVDLNDTYDPRLRPWYKKALEKKKIVWTDPYIFYTSQKPGITIAGPIYNPSGTLRCIIGVDVEIDQLSTFIAKLKIGKSGKAFMLNKNGDVVAFPNLDQLRYVDKSRSNKIRLVKINELDDILSRKAFMSINNKFGEKIYDNLEQPCFAGFEYQNKTYHTMFIQFRALQWPWIVGVYLPEDDYLGAINNNRKFNLLVTFVMSLLATILCMALSKGIIRPLSYLEKMAIAVKNDNFTTQYNIKSVYKEIQETADSFYLMKKDIQKSSKKYLGIFNNIQDVYYEITIEGKLLEVSPSLLKSFNYTREELIGSSLSGIFAKPEESDKLIQNILNKKKITDYEVVLKNKNGPLTYASLTASLITDEHGNNEIIIGSLRDITPRKIAEAKLRQYKDHLEEKVKLRTLELKKANAALIKEFEQRQISEKALRESEEKYRSILESTGEGYYECDLDGKFTFLNNTACKILGHPCDELIGQNMIKYIGLKDQTNVMHLMNLVSKDHKIINNLKITIIRKDKTKIPVRLSILPNRDYDQKITGFRGIAYDITQQEESEKQRVKLEEQLNHAQRMEAIGTLAGGIAHDFNNLLMGIQGNLAILYLGIEPDNDLYEYLETIENCIDSGASLTRQLLGFARGGKYIVTQTNLNELLQKAAILFGRTKKEIKIHGSYEKNIWLVDVDQGQIDQVLINLFVNASQAMPGGGDLYLKTANKTLDQDFVKPFNVNPGKYVQVSVSDTGIGMDQKTLKRIFEPFFTTKKLGKGTGLGLASVFGIIKNHDGIIYAKNKKGQGVTFNMFLPISKIASKELKTQPKELKTGHETILLVDDEEYILDAFTLMLKDLGYLVHTAICGKEAVKIYNDKMEQIDLVILDMVMPDISGGEILDILKELNPQVKIIISSGYNLKHLAKEMHNRKFDAFIQKPFNMRQLSNKIRIVLDG